MAYVSGNRPVSGPIDKYLCESDIFWLTPVSLSNLLMNGQTEQYRKIRLLSKMWDCSSLLNPQLPQKMLLVFEKNFLLRYSEKHIIYSIIRSCKQLRQIINLSFKPNFLKPRLIQFRGPPFTQMCFTIAK